MGHGNRAHLDLGRVAVIASVRVNGVDLGTVWHEPFRSDVTTALQSGRNAIEITVANLWTNRLIGDAALPEEGPMEDGDWAITQRLAPDGRRIALPTRKLVELPAWYRNGEAKPAGGRMGFTTWNLFLPDEALTESGLLGPVRLVFSQDVVAR